MPYEDAGWPILSGFIGKGGVGMPYPLRMSFSSRLLILLAVSTTLSAQETKPFTLQQVLSAPYATALTAAPVGSLFAWVEDAEGRHNLYIGGKDTPARALTHNTEDDAQDITQLAWSPDGSAIAYTYGAASGADGKPANPAHLQRPTPLTVIVQPIAPGAQAITIGEGHAPLSTRDGSSLLYVRDGQIWIAELPCTTHAAGCPGSGPSDPGSAKVPTHQLIFDRGSASQLTLSPDGNTLAFISRRREINEPSHSFVALYNLTKHALSFPAPSTGDDSAPTFSPDGKQLAWLRAPFTDTPEFALNRTSPNPWSIQLLDLATNITRTAYSPEANKPGSVLPIPGDEAPYLLWTADKKIIFYSEADGWDHLYSIDTLRADAKPVLLTPGVGEVEEASMRPDGRSMAFASNQLRPPSPLDARGPAATPDPSDIDLRHIWRIDFDPSPHLSVAVPSEWIAAHPVFSDKELAVLASWAKYPMHPTRVVGNDTDPLNGAFDRPDYSTSQLVIPQQALFKSTDNLTIHGQIFLPCHDKVQFLRECPQKHPAILFFHGGPRRQMLLGYPPGLYYNNAYAMNQYLTSRGFIVLSVNYRCGIGYGLNFRQCEHEGATGAAEYADVLAAAKYLQSRPDVDAKRIGIWGGSYGGLLTALALARNSDIFAAGVDFHGVHDWTLEDNAGDWLRGNNAQRDAIGALAFKNSPMADVDRWRSPVLLIHGDNDPDVAYAQTPLLADALRARHVPVEELIFPDELHGFVLHRDWLAAYTAAAAFFERILKPSQ